MAEGKKQRKFGRNGRNNSSQLQVARTAANKARNARRAAMLAKAGKRMWVVPRGAARALRRALKFWGKLYSEKIGSVTYDYAESVVGAANTQKLESLYD